MPFNSIVDHQRRYGGTGVRRNLRSTFNSIVDHQGKICYEIHKFYLPAFNSIVDHLLCVQRC